MAALDTNVLARLIVQDDAGQCAAARHLISRHTALGTVLFVPVTVVLELEWVLRSRYGVGKAEVVQTLSTLLSAQELSLESEQALEVALYVFSQGSADFADCLHVALASQAGEQPLWTFNKSAAKLSGAQLLPAS